ncbi:uncharacterized protein LOC129751372 [Uranotaenia lowii]|uniref:uncharacterized protein LOC129751372 n=1 Tax=Uranotaenia lowii TaxID=190385 RepID=UPI002478F682|nr:uncharacterized protein LOC129751372 [Uranotaenia lowii]
MNYCTCVFIIVFGIIFPNVSAKSVKFYNMSYEFNPEYSIGSLQVSIDDTNYGVGLSSEVLKRIDGKFWVTGVLSRKVKNEYISMANVHMDTCETDPTESDNPIVKFVSMEAKKFVSFGLKCPYEPGHYAVNNFNFEDKRAMVKLIPSGSYRMSMSSEHQPAGSAVMHKVMSFSFNVDVE